MTARRLWDWYWRNRWQVGYWSMLAAWTVVRLQVAERDRTIAALRQAQALNGETVRLLADEVAEWRQHAERHPGWRYSGT